MPERSPARRPGPAVRSRWRWCWSGPVVDAITATGQIEPLQSIELRPEVDGRLVQIMVREGALVSQGNSALQGGRRRAQGPGGPGPGRPRPGPAGADPTRALLADKAAAPADVERPRPRCGAPRRGSICSNRLDRTVVRAPFTGVAGQRLASLGDYVNNSTRPHPQTVHPRAAFQVPERYADQLKVGQRCSSGSPRRRRDFTGTVDFVDPRVQLPSRSITIKALVPNPRRELASGCSSRPGCRPPPGPPRWSSRRTRSARSPGRCTCG